MAVATAPKPVLHLQECTYTSCYCEENVYFLLKQLVEQHGRTGLFAVFISNADETVSILQLRLIEIALYVILPQDASPDNPVLCSCH